MARLARGLVDPFAEAQAAVRRIEGSPLGPIAQELSKAIEAAKQSPSPGEMSPEQLARLARYITEIVSPLPRSYGDRFWFDAGLIRAMSGDWSDGKLFSSMIIPCYETQWGYARFPMPLSEVCSASTPGHSNIVELIFLPKADDLAQVALLDYPWIAHELAHSLMFRYDTVLLPLIRPVIEAALQKRRLAAIADRGRAQALSQRALREFSTFWMPTVDHGNWSHELNADLIAFWVLGAPYLAVFEDLLGDDSQNPYQVSTVHPPYEVRVTALLRAASRLRLAEQTTALKNVLAGWASSRWHSAKSNRYRSLAAVEVIDGLIDGAFRFCEQLNLRRWPNRVADSAKWDCDVCELGTDLLTTAWEIYSHKGQDGYRKWEEQTVAALADCLRQ